jgi:hypothetical protein
MLKYIAAIVTSPLKTENDDITNFDGPLIIPALLESTWIFNASHQRQN